MHPELVLKTLNNWSGMGTRWSEQTPAANNQRAVLTDPCWWSLSLAGVYLCAKLAYDSLLLPTLHWSTCEMGLHGTLGKASQSSFYCTKAITVHAAVARRK